MLPWLCLQWCCMYEEICCRAEIGLTDYLDTRQQNQNCQVAKGIPTGPGRLTSCTLWPPPTLSMVGNQGQYKIISAKLK